MPSPRFGSMANSMYGSIGGLANKILRGRNLHPIAQAAQGVSGAYGGIGGAAVTNMMNSRSAANNIRMGKKVVGIGAAMGGLGMANRRGPVGGYNPQRPVMQVPRNGQAI